MDKKLVLVMDDENVVRQLIGKLLEFLKYDVVLCSDGEEAVKVHKESFENKIFFDLIIMDLSVPGGMDGIKALSKMREVEPEILAIITSGYSNDDVIDESKKAGFKGFLQKPFELNTLKELLNKVMSENQK